MLNKRFNFVQISKLVILNYKYIGKMKRVVLLISVLIYLTNSYSQASIEWAECYGGGGDDYGFAILPAGDSGFVVSGSTASPDEDVIGYNGGIDVWIVGLDSDGNILWQNAIGGSLEDDVHGMAPTSDGGYILTGFTWSTDGDVTENKGKRDVWVVKINAAGEIVWQKTYGGADEDGANRIISTIDGGYLVIGNTSSTDGDVTFNNGNFDAWLIKLDVDGNIEWQKTYGGTKGDYGYSVRETNDGYILACLSYSDNGDVTDNHGRTDSADYWVIKTDLLGNISWQKSLGGNKNDFTRDVEVTVDDNYVVIGSSFSNNGDVTDHIGSTDESDLWAVKLDVDGNMLWNHSLGGSFSEQGHNLQKDFDGGLIIAGEAESNDFDVSGHHGSTESPDFWILKITTYGEPVWQRSYGGIQYDVSRAIYPISPDNEYIACGFTGSTSGDVTGHHGDSTNLDYWVVKFGLCDPIITAEPLGDSVCLDSIDEVTFTVATEGSNYLYTWYFNGTAISSSDSSNTLTITDIDVTDAGNYYVVVQGICGQDTSQTAVLTVLQDCNVAVNDIEFAHSASIYPNPADGSLTIQLQNIPLGNDVSIGILNMVGEIVYQENVVASSSNFTHNIMLPTGAASGNYVLQITVNKQTLRQKLVIGGK